MEAALAGGTDSERGRGQGDLLVVERGLGRHRTGGYRWWRMRWRWWRVRGREALHRALRRAERVRGVDPVVDGRSRGEAGQRRGHRRGRPARGQLTGRRTRPERWSGPVLD